MLVVQKSNSKSKNIIKIGFLSHFARTGSTYLSTRINSHNKIIVIPEARILNEIKKYFIYNKNQLNKDKIIQLLTKLYNDTKFKSWKLNKLELIEFIISKDIKCWQNLFYFICIFYKNKKKPEADTIIFKKKESYKYFIEFHKIYKLSFIIFMIRDPRAIYYSSINLKHSITGKTFFKNFFDLSFKWNHFIYHLFKTYKKNKQNFKLVKYENMIDNFEETIIDLLKFLNIINLNKNESYYKELSFLKKDNKFSLISENDKHLHLNIRKKIMVNNNLKWINKISFNKRIFIFFLCLFFIKKLKYNF